jgi:hypothetical protein
MSLDIQESRLEYNKPRFSGFEITAIVCFILSVIITFTFKNSSSFYRGLKYSELYHTYGIDERALIFGLILASFGAFWLLYSNFWATKHFELSISNGSLDYKSNRKTKSIALSEIGKIIVARSKVIRAQGAVMRAPNSYITILDKEVSPQQLLNISIPEGGLDIESICGWIKRHLDSEDLSGIPVEIPSDWRMGGA